MPEPVAEEVITHSAEETIAWGRKLAEKLHPPVLVLLSGELGSGKTTLTKGIVAGLHAAPEDEVTSPTFTLVHEYGSGNKVFHGDLTASRASTISRLWAWRISSRSRRSSSWNGARNSR